MHTFPSMLPKFLQKSFSIFNIIKDTASSDLTDYLWIKIGNCFPFYL